MVRLGRIQKVAGNLYRDLDTGRFLSSEQVAPILAQARAYGTMGSSAAPRHEKAISRLSELFAVDRQQVREQYIQWLEEYNIKGTSFNDFFGESP